MPERPSHQRFNKDNPFRIFMGFDSHEEIAWDVMKFSMFRRTSVPLDIIPLKRNEFQRRGIYWRQQDPKQSTEFTYCRFLVPYLNNYKGWAMFVDDDFLCLADMADLLDQLDDKYAIMCVKHDYNPTVSVKLAGCQQETYPRKNWSSMVLYNCGHPANQALTLELLNSQTGTFLHRFSWITDDSLIGEIDYEWNFLVGWYKQYETYPQRKAKVIHYTEGGPWFPDYRENGQPYNKEWEEELIEYEKTLPEKRQLCPYERFSTVTPPSKPREGYPNSSQPWTWGVPYSLDYLNVNIVPKAA